jgi:hypothetical protein
MAQDEKAKLEAEEKARADAAAKAKADADAKAKADADAERSKSWKPRKGAPCTAIYMTGGPVFVETPGKILELHEDDTATVEFTTPKGRRNTLERVPLTERGLVHARTGFAPPAS